MISVDVLSRQERPDMTKVVVRLVSNEVCSVEGEQTEKLDRSSDYHKYLHDNQIVHQHSKATSEVTAFVPHPYSDSKLMEILEESISSLEQDTSDIKNFESDKASIQENSIADGGIERVSYQTEKTPQNIIDTLLEAFPDIDLKGIRFIGSPVWHSFVEKTIVGVIYWSTKYPENIRSNPDVYTASRKFCLEDKKFYDKCYVKTSEHPALIPSYCDVVIKSFNTNIEEGLVLPDFVDYYFKGDPELVEKHFNLPYKRGKFATHYGATIHNGEVVRVKQYCYNEQTVLADWT